MIPVRREHRSIISVCHQADRAGKPLCFSFASVNGATSFVTIGPYTQIVSGKEEGATVGAGREGGVTCEGVRHVNICPSSEKML